MDYYEKIIDGFTVTNIKDQKLIDFLNNLKSIKLRRILREYLEQKCFFEYYTIKDLKEDFKRHEENDVDKYFLPNMNDRVEGILKMLLDNYRIDY